MICVKGLAAQKSQRRFAAVIYGEDAMTGDGFDNDSALRAQIRRLMEKARFSYRAGTRSSWPGGG